MIAYLKDGSIREDTTAPGLAEARQKLQYLKMSKKERLDYDRHMDAIMTQNDVLDTAKMEGRAEGRAEEKVVLAPGFKHAGTPLHVIAQVTGLSIEEIETL